MLTGFSNIFKNIIERRKISKSVAMATQGSHHGVLKHFSFFFTFVPVLFVCIFVQNDFKFLELMFINEHLSFDMSVKFGNFLKNNLILKFKRSGDFFSNNVNWRRCELPRSNFEYRFTHFRIM